MITKYEKSMTRITEINHIDVLYASKIMQFQNYTELNYSILPQTLIKDYLVSTRYVYNIQTLSLQWKHSSLTTEYYKCFLTRDLPTKRNAEER